MAEEKSKTDKPVSDKLAGFLDRLFSLTADKGKKKTNEAKK